MELKQYSTVITIHRFKKIFMLQIQELTYEHPNKDVLFDKISLSLLAQNKIALIGNNGTGKSTLLKLIAGELKPNSGRIIGAPSIFIVPQLFDRYKDMTVAQAIGIDHKLQALSRIQNGSIDEDDFDIIADDWLIEDQFYPCLENWGLQNISPSTSFFNLSGGQKTKVFLSAIQLFNPDLILMDEPSNHLDYSSRLQLYSFIQETTKTLLITSHDRTLLNLLNKTIEVSNKGLTVYSGNYDHFLEQKKIEQESLYHDIQSYQKELKQAKQKQKETNERQNKLDARGHKKQEKAGVARIMMNVLKNKAENSSTKIKAVHQEKTAKLKENIKDLQSSIPDVDQIKFDIKDSNLHQGKVLVELENVNLLLAGRNLWVLNISKKIRSADRIAIQGHNASGKTTLIKMILGTIEPSCGTVKTQIEKAFYIDQDYSILEDNLTLTEYLQLYNSKQLSNSEINTWLKRFLFQPDDWKKKIGVLSGGERLRLIMCSLTVQKESPDVLILDEPTNNLDLQNINILTQAVQSFKGTVIVVSHDKTFLDEIRITDSINLSNT